MAVDIFINIRKNAAMRFDSVAGRDFADLLDSVARCIANEESYDYPDETLEDSLLSRAVVKYDKQIVPRITHGINVTRREIKDSDKVVEEITEGKMMNGMKKSAILEWMKAEMPADILKKTLQSKMDGQAISLIVEGYSTGVFRKQELDSICKAVDRLTDIDRTYPMKRTLFSIMKDVVENSRTSLNALRFINTCNVIHDCEERTGVKLSDDSIKVLSEYFSKSGDKERANRLSDVLAHIDDGFGSSFGLDGMLQVIKTGISFSRAAEIINAVCVIQNCIDRGFPEEWGIQCIRQGYTRQQIEKEFFMRTEQEL